MSDSKKKVLKVIEASTKVDERSTTLLDLEEAGRLFPFVVLDILEEFYQKEQAELRIDSSIPGFLIRYLLPRGAVQLDRITDMTLRPKTLMQTARENKVATKHSKEELVGETRYVLSFTNDRRALAYSPQAKTTDPNLCLAAGTNVSARGFVVKAALLPPSLCWQHAAVTTFTSESQALDIIRKELLRTDFYDWVRQPRSPSLEQSKSPSYELPYTPPIAPKATKAQQNAMTQFREILGIDLTMPIELLENCLYNLFEFNTWNQLVHSRDKATVRSLEQQAELRIQKREQRKQNFALKLELSEKKRIAFEKFKKKDLNQLSAKESKLVNQMQEQTPEYLSLQTQLSNAIEFADLKKVTYLREKLGERICPHLAFLADWILSNKNKADRTIFETVCTKFGVNIDYTVFCQSCGEKLQEITEEDVTLINIKEYIGNTDEGVESSIYTTTSRIIGQFITFSLSWQDKVRQVTRLIASIILEPLQEIASGLSRVKAIQSDTALEVYTAIYCFATLAHFVYNHKGKIAFRIKPMYPGLVNVKQEDAVEGGEAAPRVDERKITAQVAGKLLLRYKHVELNNNPVINMQNVMATFAQAYRWAASATFEIRERTTYTMEDPLAQALQHSPKNAQKTQSDVLAMFRDYAKEEIVNEPAIPESVKLRDWHVRYDGIRIRGIEDWKHGLRDFAKPVADDWAKQWKFPYDKFLADSKKSNGNNTQAFFVLFEQRCPEGDLHELLESKCTKCGLTTTMLAEKDSAYYNKYLKAYQKYEADRNEAIQREVLAEAKKKSRATRHSPVSLPKSDNNKLVELAKRLGLSASFLFSLGLMEGHSIADIESGRVVPYKDLEASLARTRNQSILNYIYLLKQHYNACRNLDRFHGNIPAEYLPLLNQQPTQGFSDLPALAPDSYAEALDHADPIHAGYYLLDAFASVFSFILESFEKQGHRAFAKHFASVMTAAIRSSELIMTTFQLKHIKTSAMVQEDTSREDFDALLTLEEDDSGARDELEEEEEDADQMDEADIDEDIDEDHFEVDLADKEGSD